MQNDTDLRQTDDDRYGDEVLNASWLPRDVLAPELRCGSSNDEQAEAPANTGNVDDVLSRIYSVQE